MPTAYTIEMASVRCIKSTSLQTSQHAKTFNQSKPYKFLKQQQLATVCEEDTGEDEGHGGPTTLDKLKNEFIIKSKNSN